MTYFYITREANELFVIRASADRHETASGPWHKNEVAWKQCENDAKREAKRTGKRAEYTVLPDNVAREAESPSHACWIVE